jgi:hypothetical protein
MANKVVGFEIRFEGFTELVKLNDSLKDQKKILEDLRKTQGATSDAYQKQAEVVGKLQAEIKQKRTEQSKEIAEQKKATAEIEKALKQNGKELDAYEQKSKLLNLLRKDYKALAAAEGDTTDETKRLLKEIQKLDKELKGIDSSVGQSQRNVGNYSSAFDGLSGLMSGNLSTALAGTGAGLAVVAGIEIGTEIATQIKEITDEFVQLRGEIQQLTDVTGEELDNFTISVSSIAKTFNKDTNEVTLAANSLAKNMGISFTESLNLIEQGFLSGGDANGEFLDSVREYPSFFKDAGTSAEQFISLITQQVKDGIFSDKGVDAFKEAKLSLTELPKVTIDALAAIGISSTEIRDKIDKDGVGGAIQMVAKKMGTLKKDSPAVGQALADIFKGAGEDAGAGFIIDSFSNMDTKMIDLIDTSNVLTNKQLTLLDANKGLATAQNELTLALSGTGINFDALLINVQTLALDGLIQLINIVKDTVAIFSPFFDLIGEVSNSLGFASEETSILVDATTRALNPIRFISESLRLLAAAAGFVADKIRDALVYFNLLEEKQVTGNKENARTAILYKGAGDGAKKYGSEVEKLKAELVQIESQMQKNAITGRNDEKLNTRKVELTKQIAAANKNETKTVIAATGAKTSNTASRKESVKQLEAEAGSVKDLTSKISKLKQEIDNSSDENVIATKLKEISQYETQLDAVKTKIQDLSDELKRANDITGTQTTELEILNLPTFLDSDLLKKEIKKSEKDITDYISRTSGFYKEFNETQKEEQNQTNIEKYETDFENEQLFFTKRLDALELLYTNSLLLEEDYNAKKKELNQEIFDYSVGIANESVKTIGMIQDARMAKELAQVGDDEAAKEAIEKKYAKKKQNLAVVQAIIDGASGIVKTGATLGYPLAIPFQILQGIQTIAQIAAIKAQKFATGGRVQGSNIPTQANGDSVLATLKPREIVLTESDQNVLGGAATFDKLVNGRNRFATGGIVAPSVIPRVSRETSFNMIQNNDAIFDLINAVNERIDRIEVVADPSQIVRQGDKQIRKVKMMEV